MQTNLDTIKINRKIFDKKLSAFLSEKNKYKKYEKARDLSLFLTHRGIGIYVCEELENYYNSIAQSISIELSQEYNQTRILHVMSEAYKSGGHTRVVEKWINTTKDTYISDLVVLNQDLEFPEKLSNIVKSQNGNLFIYDYKKTEVDRAIDLRKLASNYKYIVLHTHMYDPTALIAFGTKEFKRPIILFNHADHMFWLGSSIADIVAELSENRSSFTKERRGIKRNLPLGILPDVTVNTNISKDQARENLGLNQKDKIIITVGTHFKYSPILGNSLLKVLEPILKSENIKLYIIGVKKNDWRKFLNKYPNKIKILRNVDYATEYFQYIKAADLVIDSYPMSGGTVMIDAVMQGVPVLSLENPIGQLDYLVNSNAFARTEEDFIKKILKVLNETNFSNQIINETKNNLKKECSEENWIKKLKIIENNLPNEHNLYKIENYSTEISVRDILLDILYKKYYYKMHRKQIFKNMFSLKKNIR